MTQKQPPRGKIIAGMIQLFITAPIFYYLMYQVLKMVGATELMMFLFWIYLPLGLLVSSIRMVAEDK